MDTHSLTGRKFIRMAAVVFFLLYFVIGLAVVRDYGISTDEEIQRVHSLINYKYIKEKVIQKEIDDGYLSLFQDLDEYSYKYYGVALQVPLVLIEDIFDFSMTTRQIFLMRHIFNFGICFLGYICFYFMLEKIFKNGGLALLGVMLLSLYPRFYGNQFFDIKNMVFAGMSMITFFTLVNVVEKCSVKNIAFFAMAAAVSTNLRIMGACFPVILLGYFLLSDLTDYVRNRTAEKHAAFLENVWRVCKKYILTGSLFFFFWFLITPAAWEHPFDMFFSTGEKFSHWALGSMLFNGKVITSEELPWYYLFVWFGISIPLVYQLLFVLGHVYAVIKMIKSHNKWQDMIGKYKWLVCMLAFFWINVGAVIILKLWIYTEWRHMYFTFVPFCVIAVYGIHLLVEFVNRKVIYCIMILCLSSQILWSIRNHPYQYVYFNIIGKQFAADFDRDSWRVANCDMIRWILEREEIVDVKAGTVIAYNMFTEEEQRRIHIRQNEDMEYMIENYRNMAGNVVEYEGYEEVYAIWVDGFKIGSVFHKVDAD